VITLYFGHVSIETTQTDLHSHLALEEAAPVTLNHDGYAADTSPLRCFGSKAYAQALDQSSPWRVFSSPAYHHRQAQPSTLGSLLSFRVQQPRFAGVRTRPLRHQLTILRRQRAGRPRLFSADRSLRVWLYRIRDGNRRPLAS